MFAGDHLLIQEENGDIAVWDERGANHERTILGDGEATTFTAGPPGRLLARSTNEGTITLQDLDDGSRIATFGTRSDSSFFRSGLAFSPDEATLYSIAEEPGEGNLAELVYRDLSDPALAAAACKAAGTTLSDAEWRRLVVGTEPPGDLRCG